MIKKKPIRLRKNGGPVVFIGSMNAMPMMYALELKKLGVDVLYFIDAPVSNKLCRPENHFSEITYPYPEWIVEKPIKTQMAIPFLRRFFASMLEKEIKLKSKKSPQAIVLNGFYCSLAPYFKYECSKIALSHGSDLDSWADIEGAEVLAKNFCKYSFFKYLPKFIARIMIINAVKNQYKGISSCNKVIYFPRGFNEIGDRVVRKLEQQGVEYLDRYDISFEPLKNETREFKKSDGNLIIFSGVRFTFETFSEGNDGYNKGNDKIIKGLADFYKENKSIEIHFVEKGPDVEKAKSLCRELEIENAVIWHKEMKFTELLDLYRRSDICFDQTGDHWVAAIGSYALWLGKPLIANDELPVRNGIWPKDNPICSAKSSKSILSHLRNLTSEKHRNELSKASKKFADEYLSPEKLISKAFEII